MILHGLKVANLRKFVTPTRLCGLGPGLNVLAARNEFGKSTLLAALRAAFMWRYSSTSRSVKELRPFTDQSTGPSVHVDFSINDIPCHLEKRFLSRAGMSLKVGEETFANADAEEKLHEIMGLEAQGRGEACGIWNALWVTQGDSLRQPELTGRASDALTACLEGELGNITGGAEATRLLAMVRDERAVLLDGRGNPKGRYKTAIAEEDAASAEIARLVERRRALEDDIETLAEKRRLLHHADDATRHEQETADLAQARRDHDRLRQHAARLKAAQAEVQLAQGRLAIAQDTIARRATMETERQRLRTRTDELRAAMESAQQRCDRAEQATVARQHELQGAMARLHAAQEMHRRASLREQASTWRREQADATTLVTRLEQAAAQVAQAELHLAPLHVDDAMMNRLRQAERAADRASARYSEQATRLEFSLRPDIAGQVSINGAPLSGTRLEITASTLVHVPGIGDIRITPPGDGDHEQALQARTQARDALSALLAQAGCADMTAAMDAHVAHQQAERAVGEARKMQAHLLSADMPDPAAALLAARARVMELDRLLASVAQDPDAATLPPLAEVQDALGTAETQVEAARAALLSPDGEARQARDMLTRHRTELEQAQQQLDRLTLELTRERMAQPDEALATRHQEAQAARDAAESALRMCEADRPDEDEAMVAARISRLERTLEDRRTRVGELRQDIAALSGRIGIAEGDGLDERIAEHERLRDGHARERAECARQVEILTLLADTLAATARDATEQYLAPLTRAMEPALRGLFPRAQVTLGTDFSITGITRTVTEEFADLSDGTREQIAVLARLGMADLLHTRGQQAMVVLDDALTFSDSGRMEQMFDILTEMSRRLQIIILTCRSEQFAGLGARRLSVEAVEQASSM
ncbi:AAA family ATPase [Komagataeibacter sp. FXV2]|nr:AAA family ATPase [Komagataeibacter sp. FXV2]